MQGQNWNPNVIDIRVIRKVKAVRVKGVLKYLQIVAQAIPAGNKFAM